MNTNNYSFILAALLLLLGVQAKADNLVVSDYNAEPGSQVELSVGLVNENPNYVACQMDIVLPEGITIAKNARGKYIITLNNNEDTGRFVDHSFSANFIEESRTLKLMISSMNNEKIYDNQGELFKIKFELASGLASGKYAVDFKNIQFSTSSDAPEGAKTYYLADAVSTLTVVNTANLDEMKANLNQLINEADSLMGAIEYTKVPGASDLAAALTEAKAYVQGDVTEEGISQWLISIPEYCGLVSSMNSMYMELAEKTASLEKQIESSENASSSLKEKATEYIAMVRYNLQEGSYSSEDIKNVMSELVRYEEELNATSNPDVITIYVKSDIVPYIWAWNSTGVDLNGGSWPGTNQLTNQWIDPATGDVFWTWTFSKELLPISILFNDGGTPTARQTVDINDVSTDRYFIVNWNDGTWASYEDISAQYGVQVPINIIEIPSWFQVQAGSSFTLPVSLTNTNPNYVGFQMDVVLPNGITPVLNARGNIAPMKTDRLDASHSFSCNFIEESNTIKIVCTSMESETINGDSGELFSLGLQSAAGMVSGDYWLNVNNVVFTTSSDAPEGAVGYTLRDASAGITVIGNDTLNIHVEDAGTLSSIIAEKGFDTNNIKVLTVTGHLNSDDMYTVSYMSKLETLDLSETDVTEIQSYLFDSHSNLITVVLPKNLVTIGSYAFRNCSNMKDVTFPNTLRTIGQYAFYHCYAFEHIVIPEGVTSVGYRTFYNASSSVWNEQTQQYEYRTKVKSISLPSTLTTIGNQAFGYNPMVEAVTLPEKLESLGYMAFGYCENLKSITYKSIVPIYISDYVIGSGYDSQCKLYVPEIAVSTFQNANYWMNFQIEGIDAMPENIIVTSNVTMDWPENLSTDIKPNMRIDHLANNYYEGAYGSLTVGGNSTVSLGNFNIVWDPYRDSNYNYYNSVTGSYEWKRHGYSTLVTNAPMRSDKVNVEVCTPTYRWDFISFPFDVKVKDIQNITQTNAPLVIRKYDGEKRAAAKMGETWVDMDAESTLEAGKGYIWQSADGDEGFYYNTYIVPAQNNSKKNNIFTMNDVTVQLDEYLSEFSQNRSWNLIGNPYPAFYDIRAIQTDAPIIVWNGYNYNYQAYSIVDRDPYVMNPGQAFFIQRPVNQESITFLKEGRQTTVNIVENAQYGTEAAGARSTAKAERYVFNLMLRGSDESMSDRTRIVVNPQAMLDYEAGRDASKFMSPEPKAAQLFTTQGQVRYAINERPIKDGIVELGMSIGAAGNYTISLSTQVNGEVFLIDRVADIETRLDGSEGYTFQASQGVSEGRFAIRFASGEATGISDVRGETFGERGDVYDFSGRRVNSSHLNKGLYIQNGKKTIVE